MTRVAATRGSRVVPEEAASVGSSPAIGPSKADGRRAAVVGPVPGELEFDFVTACDLLTNAQSVVLLAHIQPDADALGSALALGLGLSRRGATVQVAFSEPAAVPESLSGLPGRQLICRPADVITSPDLLVTLDVNSAGRLGSLGSLMKTAAATLVIDHHASNTRFGTHHLVDPAAESTTVLVAHLLDRLGLPIDADIAANLYAGLATDSVGFRHASADGHRLAARLLDTGMTAESLMRPITDTHPVGWLAMLSTVLSRAEVVPGAVGTRGLVWTSIRTEETVGLRSEELDSVIDIVRTTAQTHVAVVAKQTGPRQWQVSLRSLPGVDVAAAAIKLGGGGHVRAAGFSFTGTAQEAVAALIGALQPSGDTSP